MIFHVNGFKKACSIVFVITIFIQQQLGAQNQLPISNGDFESTSGSGFTDWVHRADSGASANYSIETTNLIEGSTKALKSEIFALGANGYNTSSINNYGFQVSAGKEYLVSFYAKKTGGTNPEIQVVFQSSNSFQSVKKTLSDSWQRYEHTFTVQNDANDMKLKFWYLQANVTFYLDQVTVVDLTNNTGTSINIDVSQTFQTIEGFGGGIKRRTKELYALDTATREQIEKYCFRDLEVNMIRFFVYHTLEPVNDNLNPYFLDETQLDWARYESGSNYQNHHVAAALNNAFNLSVNGFDEIIGNCNSAPGWLKTNGTHNGGGTLISGGEAEYSEFLLAFLNGMKSRYNIDVTAISPTNEPDYEVSYESMNTTPSELNGIIKNLNSRLISESLQDIKIISPECFRVHSSTNPDVSAANYVNEMFNDWEVESAVDVVATHTYADNDHSTDWNALRAAASGKPVWITESANLDSQNISMADAANYAKWMLKGFNEGGMTAYMVHLFYEEIEVDNYGSALVLWDADGNIILPKRYFVMKHFSNLVKRGYQLIGSSTDISNAMVGAFKSPDGTKVVLQIFNDGDDIDINIDVPQGTQAVTHYITSNNQGEAFSLTNDISFNPGDEEITMNMSSMSMHSIVYDIDSNLSIGEYFENDNTKILLYPNPADRQINLSFDLGDYDLTIYQLDGAKILDTELINTSSHELEISSLSSGCYFIQISSKSQQGRKTTLKFVKR